MIDPLGTREEGLMVSNLLPRDPSFNAASEARSAKASDKGTGRVERMGDAAPQ